MRTRSGTRRAVIGAAAVLMPLALLGACQTGATTVAGSADAPPAAPATPAGTPSVTPSAPTPTPTATSTASATPTASPSDTASGTPSATASVAARWPRPLGEPQQGDPVWGVYLAVGHSARDAVIDKAVRSAAKVGYQAVVGDIACDAGAIAALGLDEYDYWSGATVYFATSGDAKAFAASYTAAVAAPKAVAKINVGCLD